MQNKIILDKKLVIYVAEHTDRLVHKEFKITDTIALGMLPQTSENNIKGTGRNFGTIQSTRIK